MTLTATILGGEGRLVPDEHDAILLAERAAKLASRTDLKVGDFVRFADGTLRRVSYVWQGDWHDDGVARVQTSDGGSWYLGDDYCSFSGALFTSVRGDTMRRTDEELCGSCWYFHHDFAMAHSAVCASVPFPVWECSEEAPKV